MTDPSDDARASPHNRLPGVHSRPLPPSPLSPSAATDTRRYFLASLQPRRPSQGPASSSYRTIPRYASQPSSPLPATNPRRSASAMQAAGADGEDDQQPVDIRARIAAFEKPGPSTATAAAASPAAVTPAVAAASSSRLPSRDAFAITRVSSNPRSRNNSGSSPSTEDHHGHHVAEFGALPPQPPPRINVGASSSSSSLPLTGRGGTPLSASPKMALSPFAAAYRGGPHTIASGSTFDDLARAGQLKHKASGTSLNDFTMQSLARARESRGAASLAVSGKVPLPPTSTGSSNVSYDQGMSGRASPALPPRTHLSSTQRNRSSSSSPHLTDSSSDRPPVQRQRSRTGSGSSRHFLDDDSEDTTYGLDLHPTLQASPVSSRPASRNSSQSAPNSPLPGSSGAYKTSPRASLVPPTTHLRIHPPTPSPEKRPAEAVPIAVAAPSLPPRNRSIDATSEVSAGSSSPLSQSPVQGRRMAPALPPRATNASAESLPYVPYKPRVVSGGSAVALKVPPPPPPTSAKSPILQRASVPPSFVAPRPPQHLSRHSPSASMTSSPANSPGLGIGHQLGHRPSKSGPDPAGLSGLSTSAGAAPLSTHVGPLLPPPNRHRSSSMGGSKSSLDTTPTTTPLRNAHTINYQGRRQQQALSQSPHTGRGSKSMAPADEAARRRYEAVWEREVEKLGKSQAKRANGKRSDGSKGGVASLASQFDSSLKTSPASDSATTADSRPARLPPKQVSRIWSRSKLSAEELSRFWIAAVRWDRDGEAVLPPPPVPSKLATLPTQDGDETITKSSTTTKSDRGRAKQGLSKEAFIRGLAGIDAELTYRKEKGLKKSKSSSANANAVGTTPQRSTTTGRRSVTTPTGSPEAIKSASASLLSKSGSRNFSQPTTLGQQQQQQSLSAGATMAGGAGGSGGPSVLKRRMPPPR